MTPLRIPPARLALRLALGLVLTTVSAAHAQDRVVLRRGPFAGRIALTGLIENYTGEEIAIRLPQGEAIRQYPASDVLSIETAQTEDHDRGLELLGENRLADAQRSFESALKQEGRLWVRREILAAMVRCSLRQGDHAAAGLRFLALLGSDRGSRHFRLIPLVWTVDPAPASARQEGQAWLGSGDEAARLIGASLLLEDSANSDSARRALRELSTSTDSRIRGLAQWQAWRREVAAGALSALQLAHWQERLEQLPADLRAGPSYLLGRACVSRHDHELAAALLLWLPLVDDHDFLLAARAALEAGDSLARIGQYDESRTLYREITRRFAGTSFGDQAQAQLTVDSAKEAARHHKEFRLEK